MKNVISASRRTDIPAFYLKWFMEAISKGKIEVANPFYRKTKIKVALDPESVAWIVFWSRNYNQFIKHKNFFTDYKLFFHFTINPNSILEKHPFPINDAIIQADHLANHYNPNCIVWRYDPIVHWTDKNERIFTNHDLKQFTYLCKTLGSFGINNIYISFVSIYEKFKKRFQHTFNEMKLYEPFDTEKKRILNDLLEISDKYKMIIHSCCNDSLVSIKGIKKGHCIDGHFLNSLNYNEKISISKAPTRVDCGCTKSIDIGDYLLQPCPTGCIYCYANPKGYNLLPDEDKDLKH